MANSTKVKDYPIKVNDFSIDEKIKGLKKAIERERKIFRKHFSIASQLSSELYSLLDTRKSMFPEQYTKYGHLRKPFKGMF